MAASAKPTREGEQEEEDRLFLIRRLQPSDKSKGFLDLLSQLSPCGTVSDANFTSRVSELAALGDDHLIAVAEDGSSGRIIATGCLIVEKKFIHGCGKVGHIEDVVVDTGARGKRLGQRVVKYLAKYAKDAGCYKVILDCTQEMTGFYEKCGFKEKNVQMAKYF